jgi:hypothetical protein
MITISPIYSSIHNPKILEEYLLPDSPKIYMHGIDAQPSSNLEGIPKDANKVKTQVPQMKWNS